MTTFCPTSNIVERETSPSIVVDGMNSRITRVYDITETGGSSAAYVLLKLTAPATAQVGDLGIPLNAPPIYRIDTTRYSDGQFVGTVEYRNAGRSEQTKHEKELTEPGPDKERVSLSFAGEVYTATEALSQTKYGPDAPDFEKSIGVNFEQQVEGVELNARTGQFSVEVVLDEATVDNDWIKDRYYQIWTVNDAAFRGWPAGDVALAGINGTQRSDGSWVIEYTFQLRATEVRTDIGGIDVTSGGDPLAIPGWHYVWLHYAPELDGAGNQVPKAVGAYVAQVYERTDFANLGIAY